MKTYTFEVLALTVLLGLGACASNSPVEDSRPISEDRAVHRGTSCNAGTVAYCERRFGSPKRCSCVSKSVLDGAINVPVVQGVN